MAYDQYGNYQPTMVDNEEEKRRQEELRRQQEELLKLQTTQLAPMSPQAQQGNNLLNDYVASQEKPLAENLIPTLDNVKGAIPPQVKQGQDLLNGYQQLPNATPQVPVDKSLAPGESVVQQQQTKPPVAAPAAAPVNPALFAQKDDDGNPMPPVTAPAATAAAVPNQFNVQPAAEQMGPGTQFMDKAGWIDRLNTAKQDPKMMMNYLRDPNMPEDMAPVWQYAYGDMMNSQLKENRAKAQAQEAINNGDVKTITNALSGKDKSEDGNWLTFGLKTLFGIPDPENEAKLGINGKWQYTTNDKGENIAYLQAKNGQVIKGMNSSTMTPLGEKELIAAAGMLPAGKGEIFNETYTGSDNKNYSKRIADGKYVDENGRLKPANVTITGTLKNNLGTTRDAMKQVQGLIADDYKASGPLTSARRQEIYSQFPTLSKETIDSQIDNIVANKGKISTESTDLGTNSGASENYLSTLSKQEGANKKFEYHDKSKSSAFGKYGITENTYKGIQVADPYFKGKDITKLSEDEQDRAASVLTKTNADILKQNDIPVNDKTLSASHFLGGQGLVDYLKSGKISEDAAKANGGAEATRSEVNKRLGSQPTTAATTTRSPIDQAKKEAEVMGKLKVEERQVFEQHNANANQMIKDIDYIEKNIDVIKDNTGLMKLLQSEKPNWAAAMPFMNQREKDFLDSYSRVKGNQLVKSAVTVSPLFKPMSDSDLAAGSTIDSISLNASTDRIKERLAEAKYDLQLGRNAQSEILGRGPVYKDLTPPERSTDKQQSNQTTTAEVKPVAPTSPKKEERKTVKFSDM